MKTQIRYNDLHKWFNVCSNLSQHWQLVKLYFPFYICSADPRLEEKRDVLVLVEPNGHIFWMPQAILRSSCSFDTTYFPFDEQYCHLKFGSWTYDGTKLDLFFFQNLTQFSLSDYIASTEWTIIENVAKKFEKFYDCCPNTPFPDLKFYLRMKRNVAFYSFILILPCSLLSLLTLVIFWVPPESPAKLVLGMYLIIPALNWYFLHDNTRQTGVYITWRYNEYHWNVY